MKNALATVVYPAAQEFWNEFIQSINDQSFQDFDLVVINDGCNIKNIEPNRRRTILLNAIGDISENRQQLIDYLCDEGYENVIFADTDDLFSLNRIEIIIELLQKYDLVANELVPFDSHKKGEPSFSKVLGQSKDIDLSFVLDKNIFGLSNTGCKVNWLKGIKIERNLIAIDWFIFTNILLKGAKACFTTKAQTLYRQWGNNTIGMGQQQKQKIITGIKAKYLHFVAMKPYNNYYTEQIKWISILYNKLENGDIDEYIDQILKFENESIIWWENIKEPDNI